MFFDKMVRAHHVDRVLGQVRFSPDLFVKKRFDPGAEAFCRVP